MKAVYDGDPSDDQVRWGACADPRGVLEVGKEYEVERVEIHAWHTKVFLTGIDSGRGFNSVSFTFDKDIFAKEDDPSEGIIS